MKYSEDQLKSWCLPPSASEQEKAENAINMIKSAIYSDPTLKLWDIEIFVQGSYANNTNVKSSSDVDVCIMLKSVFDTEYPPGLGRSDYGFVEGTITYAEYKNAVLRALIAKFGQENVRVGNKSIKIKSNTYHVEADAVVALMLKNYALINSRDPNRYIEGIRLFSSSGDAVSNYPKDHISNGHSKNNATNYAYKKLVRIFKHIRNDMVSDGLINGDVITSFLVECLIWNVPNDVIMKYTSWTGRLKGAIAYLHTAIQNGKHTEWSEVSEHLDLFKDRKWTDADAKRFLLKMWEYVG